MWTGSEQDLHHLGKGGFKFDALQTPNSNPKISLSGTVPVFAEVADPRYKKNEMTGGPG